MTRRVFLGTAAAAIVARGENDPEAEIIARIKPPVFPDRDFEITRFGARGDGAMNCAESIRKAIEACANAGGGRVIVPPGVFLTGAIHLKSRVNLHLAENATLRFSRDPNDYLPAVFSRWEGTECMNYSPFLYAFEQSDIAITGAGTLDGQADCEHWWNWKGKAGCGWSKGEPDQSKDRAALEKMGETTTPAKDRVFGAGHLLRPQFIQPYRCQNVLIDGVTILNSPMWELHPVLSRNVIVRGAKINSHGPNNDGCDPESCSDVLIENCVFDTGDDCIAIKSGRNGDGRRLAAPSENIVIRNCVMKDGHGGVSIGSEISGGARNIVVADCTMSSPHLERALRIKTNSYRGGVIENVWFRNVSIGQVADEAVQIDFSYEEGAGGPFSPVVRNIYIAHVTCGRSASAFSLRGYASAPIRDVHVTDCAFDHAARPDSIEHVEGLEFKNVTINGRPARAI
ncbi:MAG TPA: glycoside hydrolase family 28 protein [Bryobacteraceae bacterium]|nr:glycoside hydrolase family 28 protein [Bryobacteraceae bacterium]